MRAVETTANLASLQVGIPRMLKHGSKEVLSGIFKSATAEPCRVGKLGVEGDGQGDTINHGGPDKAVCAYFAARYPFWQEEYGKPLSNGSFGENFTITDWTEDDLFIGDIVTVGSATLQVSQPRQPCFKLGLRNELPTLPARSALTGYTGFYFRVLEEGKVKQGDRFTLVERHALQITISEANRVMHRDKHDIASIEKLIAVPELALSWREQLQNRLTKLRNN
ncbi:MOSC domain-containing protein [Paenibacillus nanensis]|uniref:MOSC domain-containing protein n=1 Tax=Paenibacillus nanensis TaxID=393251 RepID=A0A3A1UZE6_9BACL|nr:MOSC domain-containing protein [Paenibacillus nanensis]RIX53635.1 MOSC domain-containing protein [Paenibacillus nanensis]